jgi:hypothetical protein
MFSGRREWLCCIELEGNLYCSTIGDRGCVVLNEWVIILLNGRRKRLRCMR